MAIAQSWQCGDLLLDTRDGKSYKTVLIGTQCWMSENLNFGTMIQNTGGGQLMSDNSIVEKYCWNNDQDYCDGSNGKTKKGAFYEYQEAVQYYGGQPVEPVQGVCPAGWHIPTYVDINNLMVTLGSNMATAYTKLLSGGESGFDAQLIGYRCTAMGNFRNGALGTNAVYYWSSEQSTSNTQYAKFLVLDSGNPQVQMWEYLKSLGISVRCIKNTSSYINEVKPVDLEIEKIIKTDNTHISLNVMSDDKQNVAVKVFDMQGKELITGNYNIETGINVIDITLNENMKGLYILQMMNGQKIITTKVFL